MKQPIKPYKTDDFAALFTPPAPKVTPETTKKSSTGEKQVLYYLFGGLLFVGAIAAYSIYQNGQIMQRLDTANELMEDTTKLVHLTISQLSKTNYHVHSKPGSEDTNKKS